MEYQDPGIIGVAMGRRGLRQKSLSVGGCEAILVPGIEVR
jgi:hypothetical protein